MTLNRLSLLFEYKYLMLLGFENIYELDLLIIFFNFSFLHIFKKAYEQLRLQLDHQSDACD